jgi:hypothetical protein
MSETSLLIILGAAMAESMLLSFVVIAVLRAWFMGSIFELPRSYMQARGGQLGKLLSCPLCLSYHVAFWCELLFLVPVKVYIDAWIALPLSPLVIFATAGVAQCIWFDQHKDWQ